MKTSVYIETFGCQMNVADTERAATGLCKAGYDLTTSAETADVVLFNTCSVRERAERKVFRRISELRASTNKTRPLVGVMGCVAQLEGDSIFDRAPAVNMVVGTQATDRIASLIERLQGGEETVIDLGGGRKVNPGRFLPCRGILHSWLSCQLSKAVTSFAPFVSSLTHEDGRRVGRRATS